MYSKLTFKVRHTGAVALVWAAAAQGQMPSSPVLQNAWATPGMVGAVDIAGGSGGSVYAGALSWTPGSGRFELSGGLGYETRTGRSGGAAYGIRAAIPLGGASSSFGFGAFAGIGGRSGGGKSAADSTVNTLEIPVGAAVGWRHAIGGAHGLSVYATPAFVYFSGGSKAQGLFRVGLGADFGISSALGATVGLDAGGTRPNAVGGPSGVQYGVGVSYAFGHR